MAKILYAEDDGMVRSPISMSLQKLGHEVVQAAKYTKAAEALSNQTFDLVFTDYGMGADGTGMDVVRKIQALGLNTPVIFLSDTPESRIIEQNADYTPLKNKGCIVGHHDKMMGGVRLDQLIKKTLLQGMQRVNTPPSSERVANL